MSNGGNGSLDNASSDANQNMSPSPAGAPSSSCGSSPSSDSPSNQTVSPNKTHWIAIQLVDEEGHAVPGEDYRVTLPDGTVVEGCLDGHGRAKVSGIDSGSCKLTFPNLDKDSWQAKQS